MAEPATVEELEQSIREAQDRFNQGMGADGDASPYPMLKKLRAQSPVHAGWPEMGMVGNSGDGPPTFTAYTFDTVKAIFTDTSPSARAATKMSSGHSRVRRSWRCRNPNTRSTANCMSSPSPALR